MRRMIPVTAIGLLCLALAARAQEPPVRLVRGGERLRVLYWREHEELAGLALREGEAALRRLEGLLDAEPAGRVEVYIVRSRAEFDELTGITNKPWVLGRAFLPGRTDIPYRVVVKPMGRHRLPGLLTHELAHVMLDVKMGDAADKVPRWLHEGIAQYAADEFGEAERQVIAEAAVGDRLLTIDDLDAAFEGDRQQVALAYAQSYTLVAWLSDQTPAQGIGGLLEQLGRGRDVRLALGLAFGRPVPAMEQEWLESLRRGYLHSLLPPTPELLIGAGFVVSFLLAVVVVRRRSAAARRRMEQAERARWAQGGMAAENMDPGVGADAMQPPADDEDMHESGEDLLD